MMVLEETRRLVMAPSSNLPQTENGSWLFLLAGLDHVVCLGLPPRAVISLLRATAKRVTILPEGSEVTEGDHAAAFVVASDDEAWVDEASRGYKSSIEAGASVVQLAGSARALEGGRWIVLEITSPPDSVWVRRLKRLVQLAQSRVAAIARGQIAPSARRHPSDVAFIRVPSETRTEPDPAALSIGSRSLELPSFVREIAAAAGYDFADREWSFGPPRGFSSQKVVFVIEGTDATPEIVVKLTQESRFNRRLQAEAGSLHRWASETVSFATPRVVFEGLHDDRLVLGQTAVSGRPFRAVAEPDPAGRIAGAGYRAIIDLSTNSVQPTAAGESATALSSLTADFGKAFRPPDSTAAAISATADRLGALELPAVFMHGDLGVWNLLVDPDGRIGILDWENGDPRGMPLWDLFVYSRTLGVFLADARGVRYSPAVFARQFLKDSALRRSMFEWIREYRRYVEIPVRAVDDLFIMCLVQQAVREAASLEDPAWLASHGTRYLASALARPLGFEG
ncbi:MAG: aminoglycoside phosphotransferase family protein [Acidimicrobiia bacterium]|nr:aminoglycoside phosphotransferase family protein [Acidimicrobiia bacterium]